MNENKSRAIIKKKRPKYKLTLYRIVVDCSSECSKMSKNIYIDKK